MKKLLTIMIIALLFASCYDDFRLDHTFSSVAFSKADGGSNITGVLHRTVVKNEGLKLDVGINLTGILENQTERWADFVIDPTLLTPDLIAAGYELMPADYYTLSGSRFIIAPGSILGKVTVTLDSAKFIGDQKCVNHIYAIPFRMTATSEDSINNDLKTKLVVIKYINHYEGSYDQTGTVTEFDQNGTQISVSELKNVIDFTTLALDSCVTNGMLNQTGAAFKMKVTVNGDNSVTLGNTSTSMANEVIANGSNTFDQATSTFNLNYKVVTSTGAYKTAVVKLVWRNRTRDGVNEWRR